MLRLFVSHSSKNDASLGLLSKICNKLQNHDNGCHVLVDKSGLYPSVDWERRLDEWLAECHAAVILVTEAALKSWWVLKEATILKWRWGLDPNFKHLFIVLLGGMEDRVFQQAPYKILNLQQVQFLTNHNDEPDKIVAAIEAQLAEIEAGDTAFEEMCDVVADCLADVKSKTMQRVCHKLQVEQRLGETIKWAGSDDAPQAVALARLILREHESSLQTFNKVLNAIKPPLGSESARFLYETVFPLWVCPEAAALLPLTLLDATTKNRCIAINGNKLFDFSAESVVRRAHPLDSRQRLILIDKTKTQKDSIVNEIRCYFRAHILWNPDEPDADTDGQIKTFRDPLYVLLPDNLTDAYILDELQSFYPNVEFLLAVGAEMPASTDLPANVIPLHPSIDIKLEQRLVIEMNQTKSLLDNLYGRQYR